VPDSFNGFYPILLQHTNTILNFFGFKFVQVYSRNCRRSVAARGSTKVRQR